MDYGVTQIQLLRSGNQYILRLNPLFFISNLVSVFRMCRSSQFPISHAILHLLIYCCRMKTPTSRVVIEFDINVLVFSCVVGMLCGIFGLKKTQKLNALLNLPYSTNVCHLSKMKNINTFPS